MGYIEQEGSSCRNLRDESQDHLLRRLEECVAIGDGEFPRGVHHFETATAVISAPRPGGRSGGRERVNGVQECENSNEIW